MTGNSICQVKCCKTFETDKEAKAKWAEIEAEYAEFLEEAEQEEEV